MLNRSPGPSELGETLIVRLPICVVVAACVSETEADMDDDRDGVCDDVGVIVFDTDRDDVGVDVAEFLTRLPCSCARLERLPPDA